VLPEDVEIDQRVGENQRAQVAELRALLK